MIFLILVLFWLSETGQIWGFQAFSGKPIEEMAWDLACWCILTTVRNDKIMVTVCRFFLILMLFLLSEMGQIWCFQEFWSCSVDFPHYCHPLAEIGHIWGFWALSGKRVGVNVEGRAEAYFRRFALSCLVSIKTGWKVDVATMSLVCKKVLISYNPSSVSYFSYSMEVFLKNDSIWNPVLTWLRPKMVKISSLQVPFLDK